MKKTVFSFTPFGLCLSTAMLKNQLMVKEVQCTRHLHIPPPVNLQNQKMVPSKHVL